VVSNQVWNAKWGGEAIRRTGSFQRCVMTRRALDCLMSVVHQAIDFLAVADAENQHEKGFVFDFAYEAKGADAISARIRRG